MQRIAILFAITGITSALFSDSSVHKHVARVGRIVLGLSAVLFAVTEGLALLGF